MPDIGRAPFVVLSRRARAESSRKGPPRRSMEKENRVSTFVSSTFVVFVIHTGWSGVKEKGGIADDKDRHLESASWESENRGAKRGGWREGKLKIEKKTAFFDSSLGKRTLACHDQTRARHPRHCVSLYAHRDHSSHRLAAATTGAFLVREFISIFTGLSIDLIRFYIYKDVRMHRTFCFTPNVSQYLSSIRKYTLYFQRRRYLHLVVI